MFKTLGALLFKGMGQPEPAKPVEPAWCVSDQAKRWIQELKEIEFSEMVLLAMQALDCGCESSLQLEETFEKERKTYQISKAGPQFTVIYSHFKNGKQIMGNEFEQSRDELIVGLTQCMAFIPPQTVSWHCCQHKVDAVAKIQAGAKLVRPAH